VRSKPCDPAAVHLPLGLGFPNSRVEPSTIGEASSVTVSGWQLRQAPTHSNFTGGVFRAWINFGHASQPSRSRWLQKHP